jgi:hypothetical protein
MQRRAGSVSQELWWAFAVWGAACLWLAVAAILAARRPLNPGAVDADALWAATRGLPAPWPLGLFGVRSWLAGYLAGVLVAEWSWARPHGGLVRSAALVPRRLVGYLAARVVVGQRLAALAVVALVPVIAWGPVAPAPVRELVLRGRGGALATAAVAVGVTVAVELLLRRMVRRPQPVDDPMALAADNALRSTSVHAVAGAGLAIVLLSLSLQVTNVATNLVSGPARTATVGLAWGCALAALAAWVLVGHPHRAATPALVRRARA